MDPASKLIKSILGFFFSGLSEGVEGVMGGLEKKAKAASEKIIKKITAAILLGIAYLFLALTLVFYLIDYQSVDRTKVLLGFGVIFLLIGLFTRISSLKK